MIARRLKSIITAGLPGLLAVAVFGQNAPALVGQTIVLPAKGMSSRFVDLNHDGRYDLLAVDPAEGKLLIYRQHQWGFTNSPDQAIFLPPQTAWITPYHVETNRAFEILLSTAAGLSYYRQNEHVFESTPRTLIRASQIFTNTIYPRLISVATNPVIPVVSATQAVLYRQNEVAQWTSGPPVALVANVGDWYASRNAWTMGEGVAYDLDINCKVGSTTNSLDDEKPENEAIARLLDDLRKNPAAFPGTSQVDLDGDGRKDFIVWQTLGQFDFKTDVYIYLRGADGRLPEQPTQVLHGRGFPIPLGKGQGAMPVGDLNGDGHCELVLLEPKVVAASVSGAVDALLSHGVDMALTIRSFNHGAFSRSADASIPLTVMFSLFGSGQWPFFIAGDFNGDGRPDLVVQRSSSRWEIYFSTSRGHWFESKPGMAFEVPSGGYFQRRYFEINDLDGDGRSDIVLHDQDDPNIVVYLTQTRHSKGSP